jgi:sterol desaturase/sphingolipid hydroxylase (fatty acid hydroxylase superfamily)
VFQGIGSTCVALYLIIVVRYFLFAGIPYLIFYRLGYFSNRKLSEKANFASIKFEISYSLFTSLIFAFSGALLLYAASHGHTQLYFDWKEKGWFWLALSLPVLMGLHETYFYWTHRWMHHPKIFSFVHRAHHLSKNPTPWAAFSFHPTEGIIQAIFFPLIVCVFPIYGVILLIYLMIMTLFSVINHTGFEIYPKGFEGTWVGKRWITVRHHQKHHEKFVGNYGLYFRFWDKRMKTEV